MPGPDQYLFRLGNRFYFLYEELKCTEKDEVCTRPFFYTGNAAGQPADRAACLGECCNKKTKFCNKKLL